MNQQKTDELQIAIKNMTIVFHRLPWIIRFNDFNEKQISKLNSDFYFKDIHGKDFKRSQPILPILPWHNDRVCVGFLDYFGISFCIKYS